MLNDLFQTAYQFHRNGQFAQAESVYRQLIHQQPRHADALHLLGVLCHQTARHEEAAMLIARAIAMSFAIASTPLALWVTLPVGLGFGPFRKRDF